MDDNKNISLDPNEVALLNDRADLTGESMDSSRVKLKDPAKRSDFLQEIDRIAKQEQLTITSLFENLSKIKATEVEEKLKEESFNFPQIEQEVLASLPVEERDRIEIMNTFLQKEHGMYFQTSYEQAIMKLYNKEVVIGKESVKFLYAHKELDREEIEMTYGSTYKYKGFSDQIISRREIQQQYLDDTHRSNNEIVKKIKKIEATGKYIATSENTFTPILNGFTGTLDKKIRALQFLTGFVGYCIVSLEKDPLNGHDFLDFRRQISATGIWKNNHPEQQGSLLTAKDC